MCSCRQQARVPTGILWPWGGRCCFVPGARGAHRALPRDALGCWGWASTCSPHPTACKGTSPTPLHPGRWGEPVCFYTWRPLPAPAPLPRYQGARTSRGQNQNRPLWPRDEYFTLPGWDSLTPPSLLPRGASICTLLGLWLMRNLWVLYSLVNWSPAEQKERQQTPGVQSPSWAPRCPSSLRWPGSAGEL